MIVEETTVKEATLVPPSVIAEVPVRLVPVMVIIDPAPAEVGVKFVIVGGGAIKLNPSKVAVPPRVTKLSDPEAPDPTIALIEVEETTVNDATVVPPNVIAEVPVKLVPEIFIKAPVVAIVGLKFVIVG
jgi:hypothetical protein